MLLNNLKKGSMSITEYFCKLRSVTDELAMAGSSVSSIDFITYLISGLGQAYYPVVVYIEANALKVSINEAYSMLLSHEARLESNHSGVAKETKLNFSSNVAQTGNNQKKSGNNANWNSDNQGNWNGNFVNRNGNCNFNNRGGYGSGRVGLWIKTQGEAGLEIKEEV